MNLPNPITPRVSRNLQTILALLSCVPILLAAGCGHYPVYLSEQWDIRHSSASNRLLDIGRLPVQDYPRLAKFKRAGNITLTSQGGNFATDDKLKALAALSFTNLGCLVLENARFVTDDGIQALLPIQSLTSIGLYGASITDASCDFLVAHWRLTSIFVQNCNRVTLKGIQTLATSTNLVEFGFSTDNLTQNEVLDLLGSFKKIRWCSIEDPHLKLDVNVIKAKGTERRLLISVLQNGALQANYGVTNGP